MKKLKADKENRQIERKERAEARADAQQQQQNIQYMLSAVSSTNRDNKSVS